MNDSTLDQEKQSPLDLAIACAANGWPVFPWHVVSRNGKVVKKPLIKGWLDGRATTDVETIREWFRRWPNAQPGIPTNIDVTFVDLDVKGGVDGIANWAAWADEHEVEWEPIQTTRSGGLHIGYRNPDGMEARRKINIKLPGLSDSGIDILSDQGFAAAYAVLPPLDSLPEMPPAVVDLINSQDGASRAEKVKRAPSTTPPPTGVHPDAWRGVEDIRLSLEEIDLSGRTGWDSATFDAACNLIEYANSDWSGYTAEQAHEDLLAWSPTDAGFTTADHERKWDSASKKVRDNAKERPATPGEDFRNIDDLFWASRPVLEHIEKLARSRMVSPWAVLGNVLVRTVCTIPPWVVIPPIVGRQASLNMFAAIVGPSGSGKGAAGGVAREALIWPSIIPPAEVPLGSGEGINHAYARRPGKKEEDQAGPDGLIRITSTNLFIADEIGTVAAIKGRSGSTLMSTLCQAFSGESLGHQYVDITKRIILQPDTYRLGFVTGVQPLKSDALFEDEDGGTPQRFLWFSALDPGASGEEVECPDPFDVPWPDLSYPERNSRGFYEMPVPGFMEKMVRDSRLLGLRGETESLDGHANLTRLKSAAALAILDGRLDINAEDWELSGYVMQHSDLVRSQTQQTVWDARSKGNTARKVAELMSEGEAADAVNRHAVDAIVRKLEKAEDHSLAWAKLKAGLNSKVRKFADQALALLQEEGTVEVTSITYQGNEGQRVRLIA